MTSGHPGYSQGVQMVPGEAILNDARNVIYQYIDDT